MVFWTGGDRSDHTAIDRNQWKRSTYSFCSSGNHDPANDHGVSESAIRAVPESYYEGALALGDTHERSVFCAVLPAAKSGIMAGVILGVGRAIGETMAVIMVAGNQPVIPGSVLAGVRTMTANIVLEMGYAAGLHREALIATGVVLFVFILIINVLFSLIKKGDSNG